MSGYASRHLARLAFAFVLTGVAMVANPARANGADDDGCAKDISSENISSYEIVGGQRISDDYVVLIGEATTAEGPETYAFVKIANAWRTYFIARNSEVVGSFFDQQHKRVFLWTMWVTEGPGRAFEGVSFDGVGRPEFCTTVGFPKELNEPDWAAEYLMMEGFNATSDGSATIVGEATVDRDGVEKVWTYVYRSKDGGRTWGEPKRVEKADALEGTYRKLSGMELKIYSDDLKKRRDSPLSRTPACRAPGIGGIDVEVFKVAFKSRYCNRRSESRCEALWTNFSVLLDLARADSRVADVPTASYLFATAFVESYINDFRADTRERKGSVNEDRAYWMLDPQTKQAYYGRGWAQVTWKEKYAFVGRKLGKNLLANPDVALEPEVSYEILLRSMQEGWLETYRINANGRGGTVPIVLGDFVSASSSNYAMARSDINANCKGRCDQNSRVRISGKGYIPRPEYLDASVVAENEALFFESAMCRALRP